VDFAGGSLIVALVITMIAAIILGTALPTTPAYIMLAALLIPALIKLECRRWRPTCSRSTSAA
jgi:TRAP-type uncharacterized transport system fused permease subunit